MPGMTVLTRGSFKMKRSAISGMVDPSGMSGRSASACFTQAFRFRGEKKLLRKSPSGQLL